MTKWTRKPAHERFFLSYEPEPNTGCWIWTGHLNKSGYGLFRLNGKQHKAHRAAFMMYCGDIQDGMFVCHTCDTPSCVNPRHLFVGTHEENMLDMKKKGRGNGAKGESHPKAKLTIPQVIEIRRDTRLQREIASDYGVTQGVISSIKRGDIWKSAY